LTQLIHCDKSTSSHKFTMASPSVPAPKSDKNKILTGEKNIDSFLDEIGIFANKYNINLVGGIHKPQRSTSHGFTKEGVTRDVLSYRFILQKRHMAIELTISEVAEVGAKTPFIEVEWRSFNVYSTQFATTFIIELFASEKKEQYESETFSNYRIDTHMRSLARQVCAKQAIVKLAFAIPYSFFDHDEIAQRNAMCYLKNKTITQDMLLEDPDPSESQELLDPSIFDDIISDD
jgi:hypothetical protein